MHVMCNVMWIFLLNSLSSPDKTRHRERAGFPEVPVAVSTRLPVDKERKRGETERGTQQEWEVKHVQPSKRIREREVELLAEVFQRSNDSILRRDTVIADDKEYLALPHKNRVGISKFNWLVDPPREACKSQGIGRIYEFHHRNGDIVKEVLEKAKEFSK